jgi:catechol 2,3-dioxygenase-like lactoylglutathione lyase family enzyme
MLDHIGLQARDVKASLDFYLSTFALHVAAVHHGG